MENRIKPFKTIEEQIEILKERGLLIDNEAYAKNCLLNLNYYRLSGYTLTLRKDNKFYKNIHLSNVMEIYNFDMELRAALIYIIESIEITMKTNISYFHGKKYGPLGYRDCATLNFENEQRFEEFKISLSKAINKDGNA